MRKWTEISPSDAVNLTIEDLQEIDRPTNENGDTCLWPWEPQTLTGAPLGQYHCPYCGGMQIAGIPHADWREVA